MRKKKSIKTLSLFTGAGGLDIGFHKAGFDIFACVEINSTFCKTLEINKPKYFDENCQIINIDIRDLDPKTIKADKCDFIIGGPPCQSFSAAGRRAGGVTGVNDHRGSLFEHYCRLIKYFRPKGFLFENVRGILSANKRNDWSLILATFSDLGYQIAYRVLDAADYGVPQHRERLIMVGTQKGCEFLFPQPTHGPDSQDSRPYVSCGEAIADLQNSYEQEHTYGGKYGDLLRLIPPGQNYLFFTKEMGHPNPVFAWRSRFSDFLYKADPNHPVKTIVARLGAYSGPFHWKNRRFTLEEFKRLFSFPDDYAIAGSHNIGLQQIGNSVVPAFAEQLANAVKNQLFGIDVDVKLLSAEYKLSFDKRKGDKARKTRKKRLKNENIEYPLLELINCDEKPNCNGKKTALETYYCSYANWKKITRKKTKGLLPNESLFRVTESFDSGTSHLTVTRLKNGRSPDCLLLTYNLEFHSAIGDGLKSIVCELKSNQEEDIVVAWDAIEHCLTKHSNYLSLMDVFGHFTEPHPIFDLKLKIFKKSPGFLLRFIAYFSDFSKIAINYPASLLQSFYGKGTDFDFLSTVKWLRSMRFDIRVFETNRTISPGFFRCCYPFTLHIDKQVSISWIDSPTLISPNISINR